MSGAAGRLRARPQERHDDYALCPEDGYWFRPAYTRASALSAARSHPVEHLRRRCVRMDRSWLGVALFALLSLGMSALVLFMYFRA